MSVDTLDKSFKIFKFGACDLHDAMAIPEITNNYVFSGRLSQRYKNIQDFQNIEEYHPRSSSTSLMSLYANPGPIGYRIYENLEKMKPTDLKFRHFVALEEGFKYPYLDLFRKHATKNDLLVLSFSTEFYTKLLVNNECISIHPSMDVFRNDPTDRLHWLSNYFTRDNFLLCYDEQKNVSENLHYGKQFAKDIAEIFEDRIILVDTHISNVILENGKMRPVNFLVDDFIKCYRQKKIIPDVRQTHHDERYVRALISRFKQQYPHDIPMVSIDRNRCFMDPNHSSGFAPIHLHAQSSREIGLEVLKHIQQHQDRVHKAMLAESKLVL